VLRDGAQAPGSSVPPSINPYLNRDLSWLAFNDRVLAEAADPTVPPLERLRFATIVSSNLDEFFMVRVAEVARHAHRQSSARYPDGLTAGEVLVQIREHVIRQKARQARVLRNVFAALREAGIEVMESFEKDRSADHEIEARLPDIRYLMLDSTAPLPHLPGNTIHVFLRFAGGYAVLGFPERESRLVELPAGQMRGRFALVERWLVARAESLFRREVVEAFPFKIIRDADLRYRPDDEGTLEAQIVGAVQRRSRARVVRLEVDAPAYSEGALFLATALRLGSEALYRFDLPLDLRALAPIYGGKAARGLRYPTVRPQIAPPMRRARDLFALLASHDVLVHHPYDSFEIVAKLVREAAHDPRVSAIYHTMYRTSEQSPILDALKDAARRGKQVTVYVEIKARFDELNNVRLAKELRRAGVTVVRALGGLKVHCKMTRIVRRDADGERAYLHLGTGNYHPDTARQYTDLGLLSSDEAIAEEVATLFEGLERGGRADRGRRRPRGRRRELLVAPGNLHQKVLALIRAEAANQRAGGRGQITAKMNSLVDQEIIAALYDASRAGVRIDLLVRGICCLRPGIPGLSENIRVVSIVDRFLEHSRIYRFHAGGEERVYLASADWMPRNFHGRFEIAFPLRDPVLKRFVIDVVLGTGLADNVKSWALRSDGRYVRIEPPEGAPPVRSQFVLEALALADYRDTVLAPRLPVRTRTRTRR
jgi:polyphosphate kinase